MARKKKNFRVKLDLSNKKCHNAHRSGSGVHDSRPKRLRTRGNVVKKEIDNFNY